MNLKIVVDKQVYRFSVSDEEATVMVETDYQERLRAAEDKTAVERRTAQQILNSLYETERNSQRRLYNHWIWPSSNEESEDGGNDAYESFAVARRNQSEGLNYRNLEQLSTCSAETETVELLTNKRMMQILWDNLTPDQMELVQEVVIKGRKQSDYAAEKNVSKAAITLRMKTIRKKLEKFIKHP